MFGHYVAMSLILQSIGVTICSTSLDRYNLESYRQNVFPCSVRFSQQTATVSPYSINRLGSVAERICVSFEVHTEFVYIT
jgi:hypothetical protein